jgi:exodeoxyribonuclease III
VAILTKAKPIQIIHDLGIPKHDQEGRTITAEFEKFYLVACYVPNAGQKLDRLAYRTKEWDPDFRNFLVELNKKKPVILCGDLNVAHHEIDIANPAGNKRSAGFTVEERAEFTKLLDLGFVDTFRNLYPKVVKYSYFNMRGSARKDNKGWRLDYFVASKILIEGGSVEDSIINNDIFGSDHTPIELKLNLSKI